MTLINTDKSGWNRKLPIRHFSLPLSGKMQDRNPPLPISISLLKYRCMVEHAHRDSGNFVKVARLLVYMCPPTSMCTGALDLVSCAGVGMPWLLKGDTGDRVIMGLDMLERLSCKTQQSMIKMGE